MSEMSVMGRSGDTKVVWDFVNVAEVENARRTFEDLVGKKKFAAFSTKSRGGEKDKRIYDFDPRAESIVLVPPMVGG